MSLHVPLDVYQRMVAFRRDLHRHPELSWEEDRTADQIEEALRALGLEPRRMARTGVVVDLPGRSGPIVALRADTDALPIHEQTGLPFASVHPDKMHACGHDGHSAMLLGAAAMLRDQDLPAPVRLIWQPAEEHATGARRLIQEGVLDGVGMIFGGHVDRHYPAGSLVVSDGAVNASSDAFSIHITGQDAHGARPHEATDAVVVGSLLVMSLQTIVSREVNPAHPSVVSIGRFAAGAAHNVIAGEAVLEGTIRAQEAHVRDHLHASLKRIAEAVAQVHEARIEVEIREGTPPVNNPIGPAAIARVAAQAVVGPHATVPLHTANMGGEDFAWYMEHVPGCYIRFGAQVPGRESYPAHSSRFDFDERALDTGAAWFTRVALEAGARLVEEAA